MLKKKTTHKKIRKTQGKRRNFLFFLKGDVTIPLLIGVLLLGAVMLAGGIFPKLDPKKLGEEAGELIPPAQEANRDNLQLSTFKFKKCSDIAAIDFLIDTSGSMQYGTKLVDLRSALRNFSNKFTDKSITGIRRFSGEGVSEPTSRLVPINFYSSNKNSFTSAVTNLYAIGGTMTATAFQAELQDLQSAVGNSQFKNYNFNLIFFTDGIPETSGNNKACPGGIGGPLCTNHPNGIGCRCFDANQDPTVNGDLATKIKALKSGTGKNVRIFSIVILDEAKDGFVKDKIINMMKSIASSPSDYFFTTNSKDFDNIFKSISQKVCN